MSKSQFDPANSKVTKDDIHQNDAWLSKVIKGNNWADKFIQWVGKQLGDFTLSARLLGMIYDHIKFTTRNHVLAIWTIGNLSYQTAHTFRAHRKWIWWIWHKMIPSFTKLAMQYADKIVSKERTYRIAGDKSTLKKSYEYTYKTAQQIVAYVGRVESVVEALAQSLYDKNRAKINLVLKEAQAAAAAAFNNSVAYTNKVRKQLILYANNMLKQANIYTDKRAKQAQQNAVNQSKIFTTEAIGLLVAGTIAAIISQQEELITAEAADAAWIAGEGALLEDQLGLFGKDLSKFRDVAFLAMMASYVGFSIADAKDTANVTVDVMRPILVPVNDAVKTLLGLL